MITSELIYQGELRTQATHTYSGTNIFTDAPLDNRGRAESFSPTDLVVVALASCIITTIAILMESENLKLTGSKLSVQKIMGSNPRRIVAIEIEIQFVDNNLTYQQKSRIEEIAQSCPVAQSLNSEIKQVVSFKYL